VTLDNLSNSDVTKVEYILNLPVVEFLNWCAYFKDKQKMIELQQRKK